MSLSQRPWRVFRDDWRTVGGAPMIFSATAAPLAAPNYVSFFDRFMGGRRRWRVMRHLVRERERLAEVSRGGSPRNPIPVVSASVVEVRVAALTCPQCEAGYRMHDHRAPAAALRAVDVRCQLCGVSRTLWFRLVESAPN
jgi:predicted Zn finger-like uncharacterized protein